METQTPRSYSVNDLPDGSSELAGAFAAAHYYGGQFTALYALASSGAMELYPGEGLGRLVREIAEAVDVAADAGEWADYENLSALLEWCKTRV